LKQVLQDLKSGATRLVDVPVPQPRPGQVLIRTRHSLVSAGTERMLIEFGRANLVGKARRQPERVRQVFDKMRTDGVVPTLAAVRDKLDEPLPLGYCNVGDVLAVGVGVSGFEPGDRVASNGKHAEIVAVPTNLCAKVPDEVGDDAASFTVLSAIALQGVRLLQPTLGEAVVVTGLGLIGLVVVQLLRAHGCRVLGLDYDPEKLALAARFGAETVDLSKGEDPVARAVAFSRGRGVDGVVIAASTSSNEPVSQAAAMCRKRGRIVLVGVAGLELSRADFYEKELSFQVSCSYGPGRYDPAYEEKGHDYPFGFVRWTQGRNFEAVLDMMAAGSLDVAPLVSNRFPIGEAGAAYDLLASDTPSLGILLDYPPARDPAAADAKQISVSIRSPAVRPRALVNAPVVAVLGAGNYASRVLIPALKGAGARLKSVVSGAGLSGVVAAEKHGLERALTDAEAAIADPDIDAVVIATRHDTHADLAVRALRAGKHVFVEKPLCLSLVELDAVRVAYDEQCKRGSAPILMVGFNRRFAPHAIKMKTLLGTIPGPKALIATVNAGAIPVGHWTQDPDVGGGRIVGEACHFIDFLRALVGAPITEAKRFATPEATRDTASISLAFEEGSIGTVHYFASGHRSFPKERIDAFAGGRVLQLDNFRRLRGYGWPGFSSMGGWRQDKGQRACASAFVAAVRDGHGTPIPFGEIAEVSDWAIRCA